MKYTRLLATTALVGMSGLTFASDANSGRNMAAACASCHGTNGKSIGGTEPLAGYPKDKMVKTLRDFRSGAKPATLMHQLSKGYKDDQIDAIATYFAAQK